MSNPLTSGFHQDAPGITRIRAPKQREELPTWEEAVPDAALRNALESIGIDSPLRLRWATSINLNGKNLQGSSWAGLRHGREITQLHLRNTDLEGDIEEFGGLKLTELDAWGTVAVGDIASLAQLTSLEVLQFSNRAQLVGDVAVFSNMASMRELVLYGAGVTGDIASLQSLARLRNLYLGSNQVFGDLQAVSGMTDMRDLYVFSSSIAGDLRALDTLTNLRTFRASNSLINQATTPVFTAHPHLSQLDLSNTQLSQQAVDNVLIGLVESLDLPNRATCNVQLQGTVAPSAPGLARVDTLVSAGWTVTHD